MTFIVVQDWSNDRLDRASYEHEREARVARVDMKVAAEGQSAFMLIVLKTVARLAPGATACV